MCLDEVPAVLTCANVISWMKLGDQLELPDLKSVCTLLMVRNFPEISKQLDFMGLSHAEIQDYFSNVLTLLAQDSRNVQKLCDIVLRAAVSWVDHDAKNRVPHLEDLLQGIPLDICSHQGILDIMDEYGSNHWS